MMELWDSAMASWVKALAKEDTKDMIVPAMTTANINPRIKAAKNKPIKASAAMIQNHQGGVGRNNRQPARQQRGQRQSRRQGEMQANAEIYITRRETGHEGERRSDTDENHEESKEIEIQEVLKHQIAIPSIKEPNRRRDRPSCQTGRWRKR